MAITVSHLTVLRAMRAGSAEVRGARCATKECHMKDHASTKWLFGLIALVGGAGCAAAGIEEDEPVVAAEERLDTSKLTGWNYVIREGIFRGGPAVLNVDGYMIETEVYGVGTDRCVWYAYKGPSTTAPWQGWYKIPGDGAANGCGADYSPAVTMFHAAGPPGQKPTRKALLASNGLGSHFIKVTENPASPFKPWERIPDSGGVAAAAIAFAKPALFVVEWRVNGKYYWTRNDVSQGLNNSRWTAWQAVPYGVLDTFPTATSDGTRIFVGGRGNDGRIWFNHTEDLGDTWYGWRPILAPSGRTFPDDNVWAPTMTIHNTKLVVAAQAGSKIYFASADPITGVTAEWTSTQAGGSGEVPGGLGSGAITGAGLGRYAIAAKMSTGSNFKINYWDPF